eukprot:scaffold69891_cov61-Phaeocystis_antarctica.AAC.5
MLGVPLSTMRGGAVGPSSSCVRHAAGGARKEEDGRKIRKRGAVCCGGMSKEYAAGDMGDVAPSLRWRRRLPRCLASAPAECGEERGQHRF